MVVIACNDYLHLPFHLKGLSKHKYTIGGKILVDIHHKYKEHREVLES